MSAEATKKPVRSRERVGADHARLWVRKITLKNPAAKAVLMAAANYMNEDGVCWPGIATLARDTDLSEDTVISRLRWCESIGVIAMFKSWVDENGQRNHEGRGRVTSSEVRFMFDANIEDIEAEAAGRSSRACLRGAAKVSHERRASEPLAPATVESKTDLGDEVSPRHGREQNPAGTGLAPGQPSTAAARTEELKPQDSPQAPQGGLHDDVVEGWEEFKSAFEADGDPIMRVSISKTLFAALGHEERQSATAAARGLVAKRSREKKPGAKPSAQTFLRERDAWPAFAKLAPSAPEEEITAHRGTPEFRAAAVYVLLVKDKSISGDRIVGRRSLFEMPDFLALAALADENGQVDTREWCRLRAEADKASIGAWRERIKRWSGIWIELRKVPEVNHDGEPIVRIHEHNGESLKFPVTFDGLLVPKPYPPRTDGTWPDGNLAKTG